jgi:hypothetical protein
MSRIREAWPSTTTLHPLRGSGIDLVDLEGHHTATDSSSQFPPAGGSDNHIRAVESEVDRLNRGQGRLSEHNAPHGDRAQQ